MSPGPTRPHTDTWAAARHRHETQNTLTTLRLQTQLLLRLAQRQENPAWQRMVVGLAAIDVDFTRLVRQLEHPNEHERWN